MCIPQSNQDHDIAETIQRAATQFEREANGAPFVVYAILDPRKRDPWRSYAAMPIYVGETKHPAARFLAHTQCRSSQNVPTLPVQQELQRIMDTGCAPAIIILQKCPTRSESLKAELKWSQALLKKGYQLHSCHPGQSRVVSQRHYDKLIANRLWKLTFKEAVDEGMIATIICAIGCFRNVIDLKQRARDEVCGARTGKLKKLVQKCEVCKARPALEVCLPDGSKAVWQLPSYEKSKKRKRGSSRMCSGR